MRGLPGVLCPESGCCGARPLLIRLFFYECLILKQMNKYLIFALSAFIAIVVAACNQTGVSPADSALGTLATARIGGVMSSSATSCSATRGNSETVITASQLPAAVLTYLRTNFAGYTLVQAEQGTSRRDGATYYEVKFTLNGVTKELHFDMTGVVIAPSPKGDGKGDGGKGDGGKGRPSNEVVITVDKLPAAVITYLNTNFAGYIITEAERGTDPTGAVYYEVKFTLNGVKKVIHFNAAGTLI